MERDWLREPTKPGDRLNAVTLTVPLPLGNYASLTGTERCASLSQTGGAIGEGAVAEITSSYLPARGTGVEVEGLETLLLRSNASIRDGKG